MEETIRIDLKPLILSAEWLGISDQSPVLLLSLKFGPGKNVKPERIAQMMMGWPDDAMLRAVVNRKAFWIEKPDGSRAEP